MFPGFYDIEPKNLMDILRGDCSYIVPFTSITLLIKKDIFEFWGNYQECIVEPFPEKDISFRKYGDQMLFRISNSMRHQDNEQYIGNSNGDVIPQKYKSVRLLNFMPPPLGFLHMLSSDFDLQHFDLARPTENEWDDLEQKYKGVL